MKLRYKYLITLILVGAILLSPILTTTPALAHPGLRVQGAKLAIDVTPGETITHKMMVSIGDTDPALDILVDVRGFGQSRDRSYRVLEDSEDTSPYSARTFITLDKTSFHLEPGDSQEVTATINVPKDVDVGGRYALIYIHSQPIGEEQVGLISAVAVPVMLTISDTELTHTASISELSVSDVITGQPIVVSTTLKNTGNHHYYKAWNQVTLTDENGKEIATVATAPSSKAIIPTYSVRFDVSFKEELPLGTYYVRSKVMLEDGTILDEATGSFEVKEPYVPPSPPACVTLTPGSAATLETGDGRISISFAKGSVTSQVEVCLQNYPLEQLPSPPSGFELATTCFRVDGLSGLLAKDATLTVKYSDADLGRAQGDASRLRLARWDEANNEWSVLKTEVDSQAMTLNTSTNQLSIWAVMVATAGTPPAAAPTEVNWVVIGGVVAGIIIIALLVYLLAVRRRRGY